MIIVSDTQLIRCIHEMIQTSLSTETNTISNCTWKFLWRHCAIWTNWHYPSLSFFITMIKLKHATYQFTLRIQYCNTTKDTPMSIRNLDQMLNLPFYLNQPFSDHTSFWKYSSISLTGKTSSLFLAHTFHVLLHNFETSTAKNKDTKYKRRYKVFLVSTNRHEKHTFHSYHIVSCRFLVKFRILGNLNHDTLHFNMIVV